MKRATILVLVLVLLPALALFAGGSGETTSTTQGPMQLTWCFYVDGPFDQPSYAEDYFYKLFPDVKITPVGLERPTFYQQLNTKLAAGEKFDMIHEWSNSNIAAHVQQGVLAELPYALMKKDMPKYFPVLTKFGREVFLSSYVNGKNYGVPTVNESQTFPFTDGIRLDWLDKVGLSSNLPDIITLDQYEEILKRFTFNDPDGNGKNDTYGFSMRAKDSLEFMFSDLLGAYNVLPGTWNKQADGTVQYGLLMDNYRELLRKVHSWYQAGYLDPEFVTQDWAGLREVWNNGRIGVIPMSTWYRLIPGGENYEQLLAVNPNAKIGMLPPVKGPSGSYGYFGWGKPTGAYSFGIQIQNDMAKVEKQLQIIDTLCTSQEWFIKSTYGEEGVNWKRNPTTGAFEYIPPYNETQKRGPIGSWFWGKFSTWDTQKVSWGNQIANWTKDATNRTFGPETSYTWLVQLSADANQAIQVAQPIWRAWSVQFITGEKDLDTDWDAYKKAVLDAGLAQVIPEANKAWSGLSDTLNFISSNID